MKTVKIKIERLNTAVHFKGTNSEGVEIQLDGSPTIGGEGKGVRPMEMLLFGIAGCSGIDVVNLLKKMRQPLEQLSIEVEGHRMENAIPAVFTKIHVHFIVTGDLKEEKVKQAISLTIGKYCSVAKMLEKAAEISCSFTVNSASGKY